MVVLTVEVEMEDLGLVHLQGLEPQVELQVVQEYPDVVIINDDQQ